MSSSHFEPLQSSRTPPLGISTLSEWDWIQPHTHTSFLDQKRANAPNANPVVSILSKLFSIILLFWYSLSKPHHHQHWSTFQQPIGQFLNLACVNTATQFNDERYLIHTHHKHISTVLISSVCLLVSDDLAKADLCVHWPDSDLVHQLEQNGQHTYTFCWLMLFLCNQFHMPDLRFEPTVWTVAAKAKNAPHTLYGIKSLVKRPADESQAGAYRLGIITLTGLSRTREGGQERERVGKRAREIRQTTVHQVSQRSLSLSLCRITFLLRFCWFFLTRSTFLTVCRTVWHFFRFSCSVLFSVSIPFILPSDHSWKQICLAVHNLN